MKNSVYNSSMIPANSESLFDSDSPPYDIQLHDGQLPRSTGKGEVLVLTDPQTESANSTIALKAGILKLTKKRKIIQIGRHPTKK